MFIPLSTTAFATLPSHMMNEASALMTLLRYLGSASGISAVAFMTTRNEAAVQSRLTEGLRPDSPIVGWARPDIDFSAVEGAGRMVGEAARQALMVAYVDTFWLLALLCFVAAPFVFTMRKPKGGWMANRPGGAAHGGE